MEDSLWIQENYGTLRVLAFDTWDDGFTEAWVVSFTQDDADYMLEELRSGQRESFTQDILADYDSDHYDVDTPEYEDLVVEVESGLWESERDWLESQL